MSQAPRALLLLFASGTLLVSAPAALGQSYTGTFNLAGGCGSSEFLSNVPLLCGAEHRALTDSCSTSCISVPEPAHRADVVKAWNRRTAPGLLACDARVDVILFNAPCGGAFSGNAEATQNLTASDLVFYVRDNPSQSGSVPVNMNVEFRGRVSGAGPFCLGGPTAFLQICAGVSGCNLNSAMDAFGSDSGPLAGYANDDSTVTFTFSSGSQPLNTSRGVQLFLKCVVQRGAGCGSETSGFSESHGTLSLPASGPVFDLPAGITCQSAELNIVDNHWMGPGCCLPRADYNGDGFVDGIDSDQFNNDFEAGNIAADYNNDGFVDGIDYDEFNNDFEAGC